MNHLDALRRHLDLYSSEYEHVILLGDFNVETKEPCMQSFLEFCGIRNLISEATCYKNPEKLSNTDLILQIVDQVSRIPVQQKLVCLTFIR